MTTDPRDAEIARLTAALAESEAAAEGALMILTQTQAERDAAVSEAKAISDHVLAFAEADTDNPVEAASQMAQRIRGLIAERDAALAQVATLREVVAFHERLVIDPAALSRRDAAIAGAYEDAAQKVSHEWEKQQPWRNTGGMNATETCATIRALTPADALAARDRRDAQMRAEGMRKAADLCGKNNGPWKASAWICREAILAAAEKEAGNG